MPRTAAEESGLIARILAGETDLFHDLIQPHERTLYMTALSLLRNEAEAEDAAQDAAIKAFRNLQSFRSDARFRTWLVSIALNEARSRLRRPEAAKTDSLDEQMEGYDGDYTPALLADWREIPSEALERQELRGILRKAVEELPQIYREVFMLRDLDELDIAETARILGVSASVVKVRLHRARILLQKRLVPILKASPVPRRRLFGGWR